MARLAEQTPLPAAQDGPGLPRVWVDPGRTFQTIEGFGELFRVLSFETIGTSTLQSRCLAGVANGTVIFSLSIS